MKLWNTRFLNCYSMDIMDSVEEEASDTEFCQDGIEGLIQEDGDIVNGLEEPMEGLIETEVNNKDEPPPQKLVLLENRHGG